MKRPLLPLLFAALAAPLLPSAAPAQAPSSLKAGSFADRLPVFTVEVVRNRKTSLSPVEDYDDKEEVVSFRMKFANNDLNKEVQGWKAKMWVFAKSITYNKVMKVLSVDEWTLDVGTRKSAEFETTAARTLYDNKDYSKYGWKYAGWVLLIRDPSGKLVASKAATESYLKNLEALESLRTGDEVDRDYKKAPVSTSTTSSTR